MLIVKVGFRTRMQESDTDEIQGHLWPRALKSIVKTGRRFGRGDVPSCSSSVCLSCIRVRQPKALDDGFVQTLHDSSQQERSQ